MRADSSLDPRSSSPRSLPSQASGSRETRGRGLGALRRSRHCTTEIHLLVKRKENKETRFLQRCYKKPLKKPS